jgi:hypothetical protein
VSTPHPPEIMYDARLESLEQQPLDPAPTSWFITHELGGPAAGTFTEVAFDDTRHPDTVLEPVVRLVAVELYGTRWAFLYPPEQYAGAIGRHSMRRRELVVVSGIEVLA